MSIHQHNHDEHLRILSTTQDIERCAHDLAKFKNGDKEFNNEVDYLQSKVNKLLAQLESHVENTRDLDDEWKVAQAALKRVREYEANKKAIVNKVVMGIVTLAIGIASGWIMNHLS